MPQAAPSSPALRFNVLDFYRYVAAVGVLIFHFSVYLPIDAALLPVIDRLQLLVDFFFILSGFVIMHVYGDGMGSIRDFGRYLQKRLARVYPLHALTLTFYVALGAAAAYGLLSVESPERYAANAIVPNLLLVQAWGTLDLLTYNYPSWSISAELLAYLLFPVLLLLTRRLGALTCLALAVLLAVAVGALFELEGWGHWTRATYELGCLRVIPSFFAGMAIYLLVTRRCTDFRVPPWAGHCAIVVPFALMALGVADELIILAFAGSVFMLARMELSAAAPMFSGLAFQSLGNASYSVYMLHPVVATALLRILPRVTGLHGKWLFLVAGAGILITTLAALISFRFIEDPARRGLSSLRLSHLIRRNRRETTEAEAF